MIASFLITLCYLIYVIANEYSDSATVAGNSLLKAIHTLQLKQILPTEIKHVLDVGAFTGEWTSYLKESMQIPNAKFIMIEANTDNARLLAGIGELYVIALLGNVDGANVTYYKALSDDAGVKTGNSVFLESSTMFQSNYTYEIRQTTTLDTVLRILQVQDVAIDIMKIDVQGSEILVLQGAKELIRRHSPVIITESSLIPFNIGAPSFHDIMVYMDTIDYVLMDIIEFHHAFYSNGLVQLIQVDCLWVSKHRIKYTYNTLKHQELIHTWHYAPSNNSILML